jgi:hypothetical protein
MAVETIVGTRSESAKTTMTNAGLGIHRRRNPVLAEGRSLMRKTLASACDDDAALGARQHYGVSKSSA